MELTFRDYKKAYRLALKLVSFGRVRIERCYRFKQRLEAIYKLYFDCICVGDEILEILREHSDSYEESFDEVRNVLMEKDKVLREILNLLSENARKFEDLKAHLEIRGISIDDTTLRALIDELEESGYVVEEEEIRLSRPL